MMVPALGKKIQLNIDGVEKQIMKKPNMVDIVDIQSMVHFKHLKMLCPGGSHLCSNINPEPFDSDVVDTSVMQFRMTTLANTCFLTVPKDMHFAADHQDFLPSKQPQVNFRHHGLHGDVMEHHKWHMQQEINQGQFDHGCCYGHGAL
jgi:hypothetical protein